ncbi:single-stranded DNA-binding protein [Piscibacillus sp. B03]|uniref:single-stranded DNA-binding protein n=1 Tax=Piscibacillus sp. B03 TaxID=3457430 RepID=UPI003FCE8691
MLNRAVLTGRLTADPDLRYTSSGIAVANFTVAVNRPFQNQQGNREADFINCVIWRKQAENLANYMKKGSMVGVDGRIQTRSFDGQDGKRVFITEIVAESVQFLENKSSEGSKSSNQQNSNTGQNEPNHKGLENEGEPVDLNDDDLPF